jgi:hypothetical protein
MKLAKTASMKIAIADLQGRPVAFFVCRPIPWEG